MAVLGRADHVDARMLQLAGLRVSSEAAVAPAMYGPAVFNQTAAPDLPGSANVSLGPYVAVTGAAVLANVPARGPMVTQHRADASVVLWAQLNDWVQPARMDLSAGNLGDSAPFQLLAASMAAATSAFTVAGANRTHPAAVHLWRTGNSTLKILAGNLESLFCTGPCAVPANLGARTLQLTLHPPALGLPAPHAWRLRTLDGFGADTVLAASDPLRVSLTLGPAAGHAFELSAL